MDYQGPETADFDNVHALNAAFLDWLTAENHAGQLPGEGQRLFARLDRQQRNRLSRVPFLLLSLGEEDETGWRAIFARVPAKRLLSRMSPADEAAAQLTTAALGFLWQLAARNPYTARLVSGASLNWCEQLSECTLVSLIARVAEEPRMLVPRSANDLELWTRLLTAGVSARRDVRVAARVAALQSVLTGTARPVDQPLASAACKLPVPSMSLADDPDDVERLSCVRPAAAWLQYAAR